MDELAWPLIKIVVALKGEWKDDPVIMFPQHVQPSHIAGCVRIGDHNATLTRPLTGKTNCVKSSVSDLIVGLHTMIPAILRGEVAQFHFMDHPHHLSFTPYGEQIRVTFESIDPNYLPVQGITVSLEDWMEAVQNATEDLIDQLVSLNPGLSEAREVKRLEECYENTASLLERWGTIAKEYRRPLIKIIITTSEEEENGYYSLEVYPEGDPRSPIIAGGIRLGTNETVLTRPLSEKTNCVNDYVGYLIPLMHTALPKIIGGEITGFHFMDDPHLLIFIPQGKRLGIIFKSTHPDFLPWQQITVPLEDWVEAVQSATRDLIDQLLSLNPRLSSTQDVKILQECYENTKGLYTESLNEKAPHNG